MIIVLAIDALEYQKVIEYNCTNLKQNFFGKTDISEFSEPRTMVLWSSFQTGENKEKEILQMGKDMWSKRWKLNETFFSNFRNPLLIDLPGYSYDLDIHSESRDLLKQFFTEKDPQKKQQIKTLYNQNAFNHHKKVKSQFLSSLSSDHDFLLGYFSIADVIGHLNFSNKILMKMIYKDLDEIAQSASKASENLIILSDHGMKQLGDFGDHSDYGFWSTASQELNNPKITDFRNLILEINQK